MDEVLVAVEKTKRDWDETYNQIQNHIQSIAEYTPTTSTTTESCSLPRVNGLVQDGLGKLRSLHFNLDLLAPQIESDEEQELAMSLVESWKNQIQSLRISHKKAQLQAQENVSKAAKQERRLLLGAGEESTNRRRNLQTNAGMTSAAGSITDSLRRTRQIMIQEVERSENMLMKTEESTGTLKKAESEYKGHRSLLMRTRNLLSTMQRQDVLDRVILAIGFLCFLLAVAYVVSKRIGILKLQRTVTAAIRAGMAGQAEIGQRAGVDGINPALVHQNAVPNMGVALEPPMHDEL